MIFSKNFFFNINIIKSSLIINRNFLSSFVHIRNNINMKNITIIKAPLKYGQTKNGVDKGSNILFKNGLKNMINNNNWHIENIYKISCNYNNFYNDIQLSSIKNTNIVGRFCKSLAEKIYDVKSLNNSFILTIGGDHSISIGSISGLLKAEPDLGIIWIDAHPDIHTIKSTESKNIHGMVNGFLLRLFDPKILNSFSWMCDYPKLLPDRIAYIGLRNIDIAEKKVLEKLKQNGMYISYMTDIQHDGIESVVNNAIKHLGNRPIHLSFDIDSIDPKIAPSTGCRCVNGLNYYDTMKAVSIIKKNTNLISMDLVEINPLLGNYNDINKTIQISKDIIKQILNNTID